jgi:1-acyl-sn-glycerol-3-phosphate acyltransferase
MWATISILLGVFVASIFESSTAITLFLLYMLYVPKKWDALRSRLPMFTWLRNTHCQLSYAGNVEVLADKNVPRLFVFYPHGVHCVGATLIGSDPFMSHLRIACSSVLFWLPIVKDFGGWAGAFPCNRKDIEAMLKSKQSVILYPGGMNEIPGATYLQSEKRRTGFIKVAMELGVDIVPCWVDGENDLYDVYHPFPALQHWCYKKFRYPWPLISWGWKWVPFLPKSKKLTVHVGDPIKTQSTGDIEKYDEMCQTILHQLKGNSK